MIAPPRPKSQRRGDFWVQQRVNSRLDHRTVGSARGRHPQIGDTHQVIADLELISGLAGTAIRKRAISAPRALNEAYCYPQPVSFSRGMRIDLNGIVVLLISGTASIDDHGQTVHVGDLRAQIRRTYSNITALIEAEGATWHDVVRTTCYLRDIERDYVVFNEERTAFYRQQGLDPLPASTGIQAILCRPELLVEIEAIAIMRAPKAPDNPEG
jgi:2-iminobutanoate/2-iminopropanoate deaminase